QAVPQMGAAAGAQVKRGPSRFISAKPALAPVNTYVKARSQPTAGPGSGGRAIFTFGPPLLLFRGRGRGGRRSRRSLGGRGRRSRGDVGRNELLHLLLLLSRAAGRRRL